MDGDYEEDPAPAGGGLDADEYERWRETADDKLRAAVHAVAGGFHSEAVLGTEQAAQCALKALLYGVGEPDRARGHELPVLAADAAGHAALKVDDEPLAALTDLARDYLPTRYPDALPGGTPHRYYGERDSARALRTTRRLLERVNTAWEALTAEDPTENEGQAPR